MFDSTIHLGDLLIALGFAFGGWKIGLVFRDSIRDLTSTVYGDDKRGVEGLVQKVKRHETILGLGGNQR